MKLALALTVLVLSGGMASLNGFGPPFWYWWLTPDQYGRWLLERGEASAAARVFVAPEWRAAARYAAGDYLEAERVWRRQQGPVADFNLGAALAQQSRYREAADSYRRALAARPRWPAAEQNLALMLHLDSRVEAAQEEGNGAALTADGLVFDQQAPRNGKREEILDAGGAGLNDAQRKTLWLRRLSASPAEFLRAKFAYQRQARQGGER